MRGKTVFITGGTDGIGQQTALQLAARGADIVLIARNKIRAENTIAQLDVSSGQKHRYYLAHLDVLNSVKEVIKTIQNNHNHIDVLINNAGVFCTTWTLTTDGIEKQFAVNHCAHFLLTTGLLPLLVKAPQGRIITVSSRVHRLHKINFDNINLEGEYDGIKAYAQSKLANIAFTYQLAENLSETSVTVNCLHPGGVATNIAFKNSKGSLYKLLWTLVKPLLSSIEKGAKTSVFLASNKSLSKITGKYFVGCKQKNSHKNSYNREMWQHLWKISEEICGESTIIKTKTK